MDSDFKFKQFVVRQDRCAMKVGTDSVLLGGWALPPSEGAILDIGSGTGLLSLMLAQRTLCDITAIEINTAAAEQAAENFQKSKWKNRLKSKCEDIQIFSKGAMGKFNYVISNPPYFAQGERSEVAARARARHSDSLNLAVLLKVVHEVLNEDGRFALVLPYSMRLEFIRNMVRQGFWIERELRVSPNPGEPPVRVLLEMRKTIPEFYSTDELAIEKGGRHVYTSSFLKYTRDFYL